MGANASHDRRISGSSVERWCTLCFGKAGDLRISVDRAMPCTLCFAKKGRRSPELRRAMVHTASERQLPWLILPVVICLSQRLSHACLSVSVLIRRNCEWLTSRIVRSADYMSLSYIALIKGQYFDRQKGVLMRMLCFFEIYPRESHALSRTASKNLLYTLTHFTAVSVLLFFAF